MPVRNTAMTVSDLTETLSAMEGSTELPIKIASYEGDHGMQIYSVRRHEVTDETGEVTDAYVVING